MLEPLLLVQLLPEQLDELLQSQLFREDRKLRVARRFFAKVRTMRARSFLTN